MMADNESLWRSWRLGGTRLALLCCCFYLPKWPSMDPGPLGHFAPGATILSTVALRSWYSLPVDRIEVEGLCVLV